MTRRRIILNHAPEAFGEDVVQGAAFAIHTDRDAPLLQASQVLRAGEVAALIAVPDGRTAHPQGLIDRFQHEAQLQGLGALSRDMAPDEGALPPVAPTRAGYCSRCRGGFATARPHASR